ncbi:MAG: hypothetical protein ABSF62_02370 [Bryobacteraceae bacterium]|jgi:hypothetical protein
MSLPLILPKQKQAPLDPSGLFEDSWYLFLQTLTGYAGSGAGLVQYGTSAFRLDQPLDQLTDATLWCETDTNLVYQWRGEDLAWVAISSGGGGGGAAATVSQTLSGGGTAIITTSTPIVGELFAILTQDAIGGTTISWDTMFSGNTPVNLDSEPNAVTVFHFIAVGALWQYVGVAA